MLTGKIDMDPALFLQCALFIIQFLLGWFVKALFDRIASLEARDASLNEKLQNLAISLPSNYVTKSEHQKVLDDIFSLLRRIEEKIDKKADKP